MPVPTPPTVPLFRRLEQGDVIPVRPVGLKPKPLSDLYHDLLHASWPQIAVLFASCFLGFNLLFALLYSLDPHGLGSIRELADIPLFWRAFFFSVHTVATIGYGDVYPVSVYANWLVVIEITLGILFFALVTGIVFARFSRPTGRILFSDVAVIQDLAGVPTMMFRTANQRRSVMFGASASVSVLMDEMVNGVEMRRFRDMKLLKSTNPAFLLTWTVMHPIDDSSPLRCLVDHQGKLDDMEIVAVLSGIDERTGQTIFARWSYGIEHLRWNSRFVDILDETPEGVTTIDYGRFNDVEEIA